MDTWKIKGKYCKLVINKGDDTVRYNKRKENSDSGQFNSKNSGPGFNSK